MTGQTRTPGHRPLPVRQLQSAGLWIRRGACRGVETELFYPDRGESCRPAKAVCDGCPVRVECLEHALTNAEKFGVWGGTSERERRRIRRERARAATRGAAA